MEQRIAILETRMEDVKEQQSEIRDELKSLSKRVSAFLYVGIGIMLSSGLVNESVAKLLKSLFGIPH